MRNKQRVSIAVASLITRNASLLSQACTGVAGMTVTAKGRSLAASRYGLTKEKQA